MVHLHIIAGLLQVQFDIVSRSDTESGVRFILSSMVQKIAYRRIGLLSLCAAIPMGVGLMDYPHALLAYCGSVMAQYSSSYVIMCMR